MRRMIGVAFALMLLTGIRLVAQLDLSGSWPARNYGDALANRPGPGPNPVEFMGVPLNDSARMRALLHSPSEISMPDRFDPIECDQRRVRRQQDQVLGPSDSEQQAVCAPANTVFCISPTLTLSLRSPPRIVARTPTRSKWRTVRVKAARCAG